jgi:hypothetical protein
MRLRSGGYSTQENTVIAITNKKIEMGSDASAKVLIVSTQVEIRHLGRTFASTATQKIRKMF